MSAPFKLPMQIIQGATFDEVVTWTAGDPPSPVDLTGCRAVSQIRSDIDSPDVLLELTTENGRIELGGTAGTVRRKISAADTAAIVWTEGVHDLKVVLPDATVRRLIAGGVGVSPEVTRV